MPDPNLSKLVNTPRNTQSGTLENREAALQAEMDQLRRVRAEQEVAAVRAKELLEKLAAPPPEFVELMREEATRKVGVVRFRDPVCLRGQRPSWDLKLVNSAGEVIENPLSPWFRSIALRDSHGDIVIWVGKSGEVIHVPRENIANYSLLDAKAEAALDASRAKVKAEKREPARTAKPAPEAAAQ